MSKRLKFLLALSIAPIAALSGGAEPVRAQAGPEQDYDLPAQPLAATIAAIARASGRNILASGRVIEGRQAPALVGRYSAEAALDRVLAASGLRVRATASGLIVEASASAPETVSATEPTDETSTIVVTGTRLRSAPVASPVIVLREDSIRNAGQATLGEVVRSVPQSFGGGQQPGIGFNVPGANGVDVGGGSSINLRGLGSDATLTLLNGRRLAYNASRQSIDVSTIPLAMVDRIEIVADGASAIYGSDAVAGVANIILKRDYDGIETRARIGGSTDGGNLQQLYGALGGTVWNGGGFALAYEYGRNSSIQAEQRSYARDRVPGLTLFPKLSNHNVLATGHQDLTADLTFSFDGLFGARREFLRYPLGTLGLAVQRAEFRSRSSAYVAAPALEWRRGDWTVSLAGTLAEDRTRFRTDEFDGDAIALTTGGCFCNKAQSIEIGGTGPVAALAGGNLEAAIGAGYRNNDFELFAGTGNAQNIARSQDSYFVYAEASVPLVGRSQAIAGIDRLNLTGAVRYERYPGIGDVATPKLGLVYAPVEPVELKASWGKSFRAPTLRQQFQPRTVSLRRPAQVGGSGFPAGSTVAVAVGGNPGLAPERATSWSATLAFRPPGWDGGRIELSYFNTRYKDRIVTPIGTTSQALANLIFQDFVTLRPSVAQVEALVASAKAFTNSSGQPYNPATVVAIIDNTNINAGRQRIQGFDALIGYRLELAASGSIDLSANASYLKSDQRISADQPTTDLAGALFNPPHFRARGSASWNTGAFTLTATLSYVGEVEDRRRAIFEQVDGMVPVDLTARYRTSGKGVLGGLDIVFGVQNLFNDKPDTISGIFLDAPYDSTNYSPVGRFVSLSVAKTW